MLFKKKEQRIIKIEGMMCAHCVKHVTDALCAIDGVNAKVNLGDKSAAVTMSKDVSNNALKAAIEGAGYTVVSIESK